MLFNSAEYWIFFPIFFVFFWLSRGQLRLGVALIGSYIFYAWWDWRFLGLIVLLTVANFWLGLAIDRTDEIRTKKRYLVASIALSLGVLCFFKYFNFFADSATGLLRASGLPVSKIHMDVVLPIGISFYTFQAMSYIIDLYRKEILVERSLLRFATFKAFFPQLVAGPIVRATDFLPQLQRDSEFSWEQFVEGCCIVMWGFVLKAVLADSIAPVIDYRFAAPESRSAISLAIGAVLYAFQIYGDFAGYSLIAIGTALTLGYRFNRNFDRPYFAASFSDFWKRWHISLSSWLRDYLYIPMGGNRGGAASTQRNLLATMLLGGLWHGAAWTFVVWGALHGLFLIVQRLVGDTWRQLRTATPVPLSFGLYVIQVIFVFSLVCLAWVFFRAQTFDDAWTVVRRIFLEGNWSFSSVEQRFEVVKALVLVFLLVCVEAVSFRVNWVEFRRTRPWATGIFLVSCAYSLVLLGTFGSNAFIYFQF